MIVFPNIVPMDFLTDYLPEYILTHIIATQDTHKFVNMDAYLESIGVEKNTIQVLATAVKNLDIKEVNGVYIIEPSNVEEINGYTLKQLVNIIDYGTTEVKGTGVYQEIERYINNNKGIIVNQYSPEE